MWLNKRCEYDEMLSNITREEGDLSLGLIWGLVGKYGRDTWGKGRDSVGPQAGYEEDVLRGKITKYGKEFSWNTTSFGMKIFPNL